MGKNVRIPSTDYPELYIWCYEGDRKFKMKVRAVMLEESVGGLVFFGHKDEYGYFISEYTSGLAAGYGNTMLAAYTMFLDRVNNFPTNVWHQNVAKGLKEYGSPANILSNVKEKITINFLRRL